MIKYNLRLKIGLNNNNEWKILFFFDLITAKLMNESKTGKKLSTAGLLLFSFVHFNREY